MLNDTDENRATSSSSMAFNEKKEYTSVIVNFLRTTDTGKDPGPPPDGGFVAWLQAILGNLVVFTTWGYINSYGVFQSYYTEALDRSQSDISWMGSVQIFFLFFIGTFSGRATDAGWFRLTFLCGIIIQLVGLFTTSVATKYYQVFLAQGVAVGIGSGLIFCSALSVVAPYFSKHRGFAIAVTATGSALGGLVYPATVSRLLPQVGFPWTMRVVSFLTLALHIPSIIFFRPRLPPRKTGPLLDLKAFKEPPYVLFTTGMFFNFWGLYVAFFYLGTFARDELDLSQSQSTDLLMVLNGIGVVSRLFPAFIADRWVGLLNSLIPFSLSTAIVMYCWAAVDSVAGLYVFAAFYGIVAAGMQALFPSTLASLTTDLSKTGIRLGMVFSCIAFACLTGTPIAGALIQRNDGYYLYAQMFAGSSMTVGSLLVMTARYKKGGLKMVKV
ncbi:hypothetical protein TRICI_000169 [Trichomonascus ciferrii]|uniref:Major facilitator superfamily (MFS) profile domain-containing protein n=1 Tax=Trichomonascus ciferrii TaxID=44093 RepID=A0A642VE55_9ASCO|nr:hypothetical protein TRICI_000169 [Trichomonascus ciferrii]